MLQNQNIHFFRSCRNQTIQKTNRHTAENEEECKSSEEKIAEPIRKYHSFSSNKKNTRISQ